MAKEKDPKLNRVTVYRTLKMLKAGGLVDELDLMHYGGDQHYYETRLKQEHAHVICLRCGKVEEFLANPCSVCVNKSRATSDSKSCSLVRKWADIVPTARRCARAKWKSSATSRRSRPNRPPRERVRGAPRWDPVSAAIPAAQTGIPLGGRPEWAPHPRSHRADTLPYRPPA